MGGLQVSKIGGFYLRPDAGGFRFAEREYTVVCDVAAYAVGDVQFTLTIQADLPLSEAFEVVSAAAGEFEDLCDRRGRLRGAACQ